MKIPKTIKINGYTITVEQDCKLESSEARYGSYHYSTKEIKLCGNVNKQNIETTFLHESIHAMLVESGVARFKDKYTEEEICKILAPALWSFIHNNSSIFS